jgi:hypothetical protein
MNKKLYIKKNITPCTSQADVCDQKPTKHTPQFKTYKTVPLYGLTDYAKYNGTGRLLTDDPGLQSLLPRQTHIQTRTTKNCNEK